MKKNKICLMLVMVLTCIMTLSNVFAVEIYDTKIMEEIYKTSEDDSSFNLPFIRVSEQRMDVDKSIAQTGMFLSSAGIDVNAPLEGVQLFCSNDTVRLNSDIESAIICSNGNVILNANVNETLMVYCSGTVTITETANVKGNIICYTPELHVNGNIDGNILGSVGIVNVNSVVNGQIRMSVNEISFGENAKVLQGISLNTSNTELKIDEAVGTATIDVIEVEQTTIKDYAVKIISAALNNIIIFLLVLIFVKNDRLNKIMDKFKGNSIIKNGIYAYVILLALICGGIVILTIIPELGFASMILSAAIMIIFTLLKDVFVGTLIVKLVEKKYNSSEAKPNNVLAAIVTFIILEILENIPYIGSLISFVIFIIAIGIGATLIKKEDNKKETEIIEVQ